LDKILTIYIPTYNRLEMISLLLTEIISFNLINTVKVLVADDGSDDNTYEKLISDFTENDITIIKHSPNIGISAGYLKFIELCETDYFMLMADDDTLRRRGIIELISFLKEEDPDVVSTAWGRIDNNNKWVDISRYKKDNPKIKLKDIRGATNHSPGVVFKTSTALQHVNTMKERLNNKCYATTIYPAVVLSLLIAFSNNNCRWFSGVTGGYRSFGALPSNLVDQDGYSWDSFIGRWKEQESFEDVYEYIHSTVTSDKYEQAIVQLLERHKMQFYYRIEEVLQGDNTNLLQYFLMTSSVRVLKSPLMFVKMVIKFLINKIKFMWYMN
jgi:glycosyltransferase involved in cell wall biosynthesis